MAEEGVRVPIDGDASGFNKEVEGMKGTISSASVAMGNLLSDLGKKALSSFGDMITSGDSFNQAINQMAASTGATGSELEGLRDVVKDVYGANFGDSYEDAATAVAEVSKQTGLLGDELQSATQDALSLGDTFGYDVTESTRAASALMNNFGISAEEAYNLIAVGAQNGADQNGDLLDTLNEYSTQYAALGLSAEQFTQSLISGAESGAFSMDKVGDAVKEFNIRCKDGSDTTAAGFEAIGMNADEMAQKFAAGGDTAQEAFFQTVNALNSMTDPVEQNQAAINLFGTQFEDLQANLLPMLASMEDASGVAYDALGSINEVKYDDIGSAVEGLKRTIGSATIDIRSNLSSGLTDAISTVVNAFNSSDGDASAFFDAIVEAAQTALSAIEPVIANWVSKGKEILEKIVEGIQNNLPLIQEKAQDILQFLINGVSSKASMITEVALPLIQSLLQGIVDNGESLLAAGQTILTNIITAIQEALPNLLPLAVQLITTLINGLSEALVSLMEFVPQIVTTICNVITENLPAIITAAIEILNTLIGGIIDNLGSILTAAIQILTSLVDMILENLPTLIDAAIQILMAVVNGILDNLPELLDAAVGMITEIVNGLVENLPDLIDGAIEILTALGEGLIDNLPELLDACLEIMLAIGEGLIKCIPDLIAMIPKILTAMKDAFMDTDWLQLGKDILTGLGNGLVEGLDSLIQTVLDVAGDIWDSFTGFFGINSPSKLMRDTVGKFILPGIAVGMEDTTDETANDLNHSLDEMMRKVDTDGLQMQLDSAVQVQGYSGLGTSPPEALYTTGAAESAEPAAEAPQYGDIIIPVSIGGTQLETVVIRAAQIANARSGGGTL